jgi:hypothetical protein
MSPSRGGLTNQIGHSGEQLVLLFFREQGALARTARVTIDGVDVSQPRPEASFAAPFAAAYSSNIMVGGFPFGDREATFGALSSTNSAAAQFALKGDNWVATRADRTTVELDATHAGDLEAYVHRDGNNKLAVRFESPIPSDARLAGRFHGRFFVSYDDSEISLRER